jgi:hypothetical protein
MVACVFSYADQCNDLNKMGPLPILRAGMNPNLHMADDLKNTCTGNPLPTFLARRRVKNPLGHSDAQTAAFDRSLTEKFPPRDVRAVWPSSC